MICIRRYVLIGDKVQKDVSKFTALGADLESVVELMETCLSTDIPLAYLKCTDTNRVLEMKLVDNQVIKSFVLDFLIFNDEIEKLI